MSRKSSTETLAAAMRVLAREIESGDSVASAAISETADRLEELQSHVMSEHLRDATKMAEQQARIAELERQAASDLTLTNEGNITSHVRGDTKMVTDQQLADAVNELRAITIAADALVDRWHTPLWKDARPTAEYIAALRLAAESARKLLKGGE